MIRRLTLLNSLILPWKQPRCSIMLLFFSHSKLKVTKWDFTQCVFCKKVAIPASLNICAAAVGQILELPLRITQHGRSATANKSFKWSWTPFHESQESKQLYQKLNISVTAWFSAELTDDATFSIKRKKKNKKTGHCTCFSLFVSVFGWIRLNFKTMICWETTHKGTGHAGQSKEEPSHLYLQSDERLHNLNTNLRKMLFFSHLHGDNVMCTVRHKHTSIIHWWPT